MGQVVLGRRDYVETVGNITDVAVERYMREHVGLFPYKGKDRIKAMACQSLQSEVLTPAPWFSSNPANTGKVSNDECSNVLVWPSPI